MSTIDVRGLSCPEPVFRVRQALASLAAGETLEVLMETVTTRENVLRSVRALGCQAEVEEVGDGFRMTILRE